MILDFVDLDNRYVIDAAGAWLRRWRAGAWRPTRSGLGTFAAEKRRNRANRRRRKFLATVATCLGVEQNG